MDEALKERWPMTRQDGAISDAIAREEYRLRNFIRKWVADPGDVEDILQDVFYELVLAYRFMKPIKQVTAWLYRVARNRITDRFRRKNREELRIESPFGQDQEVVPLEDLVRSRDAGPEEAYARSVLIQELDEALEELPKEQRDVFIAHELMGYSFNELAARSGVSVNTLLSRKHYAVMHLRKRLRAIYEEFGKQ